MTQDPFSSPSEDDPTPFGRPGPLPEQPGGGGFGAPAPYGAPGFGAPAPYGSPGFGAPAPYGGPGYPTGGYPGPGGPGYAYAQNGTPIRLASAGARIGGFFLSLLLVFVTLFIGYLIWTLVLWSSGQTPAKQILHQRVVSASHGTPATWGHMAVRNFLVGTLLNGIINSVTLSIYFFVDAGFAFSSDHRRLTDRIAQTYVAQE